jgi:hypothetical protein
MSEREQKITHGEMRAYAPHRGRHSLTPVCGFFDFAHPAQSFRQNAPI